MKHANLVMKLIFSLMGAVYTILGAVLLMQATRAAGEFGLIFSLPEEELALSICGTVFSVLGVAFLLVTLGLILQSRRRARLREELLTWGTSIQGTIIDIRIDHSIRVNGHSPLVAKVRCTLPSGEATLRSQRLWNACPATGDTVEVIYDPMDEKRYVMEFGEN